MSEELAYLVLEDGTSFRGTAYGASGKTTGEIVFSTAMTGYQETLTDPSYHRQIVVQTAPHIGNTGVNRIDPESGRVWVAGYVLRDPARRASSWRAEGELEDLLCQQQVVGISGIDTRALTRRIREHGVMRAGIFSGEALPAGSEYGAQAALDTMLALVRSTPQMVGANLTSDVSTPEAYVVEPSGRFAGQDPVAVVAAVDLGVKNRSPYHLSQLGVRVHVLPHSVRFEQIQALAPDGVFFSNGPGDPQAADSA